MGGGGKKGGGGGGGSLPSIQVPQGLFQGAGAESGLGQYATSLINPLASMTNWASSLATGGQAQAIPSFQSQAVQQGPAVVFGGKGSNWASSFDPTTGLITFTNPTNPRQTFQTGLDAQTAPGGYGTFGDLPKSVLDQWQAARQQYVAGGAATNAAPTGGAATAGFLPQQGSVRDFQTWFSSNYGKSVLVNGKNRVIGQDLQPNEALQAYQSNALSWNQTQLDPYRQLAWQDIQAQQNITQQMPALQKQTQDFINRVTAEATRQGQIGEQQLAEAQKYGTMGDVEMAQAQKFQEQGDVQNAQAQALFGRGWDELTDSEKQIAEANALVQMTTTGEGLFPAQKAMIDQARQTEEIQLNATLGAAGLGTSTQLAQLRGAADLGAAATAGQLQQGNITAAEQVVAGALGQQAGAQKTLGLSQTQAAQAAQTYGLGLTQEQIANQTYGIGISQQQLAQQSFNLQQGAEKLALGGQELATQEQAALVTELQNITTQGIAFQKSLWDQAMQGYGAIGSFLDIASKSYNYSLGSYSAMLQAQSAQAGQQAQIAQAQLAADSKSTSDLFSGLGALFGQSGGGGGGGLLGGLGGALGGAAAGAVGSGASASVAGIGGAAAGAGAAAGGGGILAGVGGALTALFCQIAQAIYGFDDPRWEQFREWLLLRGPVWLLRLYGRHADSLSEWIKDKKLLRWISGRMMQAIVRVL